MEGLYEFLDQLLDNEIVIEDGENSSKKVRHAADPEAGSQISVGTSQILRHVPAYLTLFFPSRSHISFFRHVLLFLSFSSNVLCFLFRHVLSFFSSVTCSHFSLFRQVLSMLSFSTRALSSLFPSLTYLGYEYLAATCLVPSSTLRALKAIFTNVGSGRGDCNAEALSFHSGRLSRL